MNENGNRFENAIESNTILQACNELIAIRYDTKICNTHTVDITIESEAWGYGALAAEGRLEKN